jgi:hypothetical protein
VFVSNSTPGLTRMTNNITLKIATTRHSVFMYCATPALEDSIAALASPNGFDASELRE